MSDRLLERKILPIVQVQRLSPRRGEPFFVACGLSARVLQGQGGRLGVSQLAIQDNGGLLSCRWEAS